MKTIISFSLCVMLSLNLMAAETLSFKFSNPQVVFSDPDNYLVFDVLVKASTNGTYLYSSQVNCNIALANFNTSIDPFIVKGSFIDGTYDPPPNPPFTPYEKYSVIANYNSGNLNISVLANNSLNAYLVNGHSPVSSSWQTLCTVWCTMSDASGVAGISFQPTSMNGQQKYATGVGPLYSAEYNNPSLYEGYDFADLYLARIFSGLSGWSQAGGTVDWTLPVNTSVWDTTTTAAVVGSVIVPNARANNLTIHPAARLAVPVGRSITCTGNSAIRKPRVLELSAGASGFGQYIDNGITYPNGGTVETQSYFVPNSWHYYCIPLQSASSTPYKDVFMKYYKEPVHKWWWVNAIDSTLNTKMLGYAMWATGLTGKTVSTIGVLNTGTTSLAMSKTGTDGYNLIGNPYPSAINLSVAGVNWGNCQQKAWFFDPGANNYKVYIKAGGGTRASSYCSPQQGFFVRANSATTFGVDNSTRCINSEPFLKDGENLADMLEITASCSVNSYYDKAVVRFAAESSASYDDVYDAYKMPGGYEAPQLFTILNDLSKVSVDTQPWTSQNEVVQLGFQCGMNATYTITADNLQSFNADVSISLEDKLLANTQDLRTNPSYSFTASEGENLNRFYLHFNNTTFGVDENAQANVRIYAYSDILYVKNTNALNTKGEIYVYDLLGNKVFQDDLQNNQLNAYKLQLLKGYYLVKVVAGNFIKTEKVLF
ncbi:MAG: T9SS type A sorting domain-containing protein [Bacteroidota bacterium]